MKGFFWIEFIEHNPAILNDLDYILGTLHFITSNVNTWDVIDGKETYKFSVRVTDDTVGHVRWLYNTLRDKYK